MYEDSGVRDVNFLLSGVQKCRQIHILWQKVWRRCFRGYVNWQVCPLEIFMFTDLSLYTHTHTHTHTKQVHTHIYIYVCVHLLCMWHGLGITRMT